MVDDIDKDNDNNGLPEVVAPVSGFPAPQVPQAPLQGMDVLPRKRRARRGKPLRRPQEDISGDDYVERMESLGPRDNESYFVFKRRMASVKEGRKLFYEAAVKGGGVIRDICRFLGLAPSNMPTHLRQVGLTTADLLKYSKRQYAETVEQDKQ